MAETDRADVSPSAGRAVAEGRARGPSRHAVPLSALGPPRPRNRLSAEGRGATAIRSATSTAAAPQLRVEARPGRGALHRRHARAGGHAACRRSASRRARAAGSSPSTSPPCARAPGVVAVLTAADIPGRNDVSPAFGDDPLFADNDIGFHGQALFAVVARDARRRPPRRRRSQASRSSRERPSVTVEDALERGETVLPDYAFGRGDAEAAIAGSAASARRLAAHRRPGALLPRRPGRPRDPRRGRRRCTSYSSTQHPTEVQHVVARVLGMPDAYVTCEMRRMGGGFGGKESQATQWAALAALAARVTGRPCKVRLDRDDDFVLTGKRHDFRSDWRVGFDEEGRIAGLRRRAPRALRLFRGPVAAASSTARCSTPTTPTGCRPSASARAG